MIIDIHQHITCAKFPQFSTLYGHGPFTARHLLKDMDKWGIDKSVALPLANPENSEYFGVAGNKEVVAACAKHPDRLIPFCNIDPRAMLNTPKADLSVLLRVYKDLGCRGVGEACANMEVTNPLYKNLFYGTDMFFMKSEPPPHLTMMQDALAEKKITKTMYENIMHRNFTRVFGH